MAGPGNIIIRVGAEAGQAVSELSKVNRALGENMTKSEKVGAALKRAAVPATIALSAIAVGARKAITAASDLNEQQNKSMVVFGQSGKSIIAWSKTLASSFGLSAGAALEAAGVFGNMLVPMGFTRKEAAAMSKQMVELAGDMASFNNASPEETLAALRSGLAGESEPLRKFGVFLNDARLKQEALKQGLYSGKGALDAHAKAAATMALVMRDTADAQGDFARTSDSAANAQRVQAAETANLTAELGQGLLPYYQAALKVLIAVTKAAGEHTTAIKIAIGAVAGLSAAILVANAAMKAYRGVMLIVRGATIAWTAAQRLLNLALASNPIGLVIVAVAALAAGLVIAYKRSETFRNIVSGALNAVASAAGWLARAFRSVLSAASSAWAWIASHWKLAAFALGPLGAGIVLLASHFDKVKAAGVSAFNAVRAVVDALARAIGAVINAVQSLIGWLGKIKVPKINLPRIPGVSTAGYGYGAPAPAGLAASAGAGGITVNFYGPTDPEAAARAVSRVLRAHDVRQGRLPMRRG